ncbi:MAG: hypothetical protein WCG23_05345 [bacterium]
MQKNLSKTFGIFGILIILSMFINIVNYIDNQNNPSIESQIVSAFAG